MATITDNDPALFRDGAKTELKSTGDIGRLAWDDVVEALCKEVARLRSASKEPGDAAKLREALRKINSLCGIGVVEISSFEIGSICDAALASTEGKEETILDTTSNQNTQAAKLREALESIASNLERRLFARYPSSASDEWMYQKANIALAEPVRNCDVGTATEQTHRFDRHCDKYLLNRDEDEECVGCPLVNMAGHCELNWAQLPYEAEEGGAK